MCVPLAVLACANTHRLAGKRREQGCAYQELPLLAVPAVRWQLRVPEGGRCGEGYRSVCLRLTPSETLVDHIPLQCLCSASNKLKTSMGPPARSLRVETLRAEDCSSNSMGEWIRSGSLAQTRKTFPSRTYVLLHVDICMPD